MRSEQFPDIDSRAQAADKFLAAANGSSSSESYFYNVLLPNLLPEYYPELDLPEGVSWIGKKAMESIENDLGAIKAYVLRLVKDGYMTTADHRTCQEAFGLDQVEAKSSFIR